jgi:uncharacterized protein YlxW (UPF0749 family)
MKTRISLIIIGLVTGVIIYSQFNGYNEVENGLSRNTFFSNLDQAHILAQTNQELSDELRRLEDKLREMEATTVNPESIALEIEKLEKVSGSTAVTGPGVSITISIPIESYWLIDIMNELNLAGAEAIAINDVRVTNTTSLLTTYNPEPIVTYDSLGSFSIPITIKAVGAADTMQKYMEQPTSTLSRLESSLPEFTDLYFLSKHELLMLPARAL